MILRKNHRNKKGQVFVISVVIAVTLALTSAYFLLHYMFQPKNDNEFLGSYQSGIIDALADGDKALLYVDQAAKMSIGSAMEEYFYGNPNTLSEEYASENSRDYCGSYVYRLWNNESKDCYPQYSNSQTFELNTLITKHLNALTSLQPIAKKPIYMDSVLKQNINYEYKYEANTEYTNIYGFTNDKYTINIFRDSTTKADTGINKYLQTKGTYSGDLAWPVPNNYYVSSCFGYRGIITTKSNVKGSENHPGIDIPAQVDTAVVAAAPGTVVQILYPAWGKVIIDHGGGLKTDYIHMNKIAEGLTVGDIVTQGQVIGYVGGRGANSATDYEYHLHFDVISDNVDPKTVYQGVSGIVTGSTGVHYVNPLCFMNANSGSGSNAQGTSGTSQSGLSPLPLTFNMNSQACNAVCDTPKHCADTKEIPSGAPYKFCNVYQGVVAKEVPCTKSDKADWEINKVELSSTELTSDQTLTISFSVINKGDVCVAIYTKPRITTWGHDYTIDTKTSTNVYKTVDKKTSTDLNSIKCTFSSDEQIIAKAQSEGKCVLWSPEDDKTTTYTIQPKELFADYKNKKVDYTGPELHFNVKKGNTVTADSSTEEKLSAEYDNIKAKIKSLNLKPILPGESVLIVDGTQPQKIYLVKEVSKGVISKETISIEKTYDVSLAANGFGNTAGTGTTPIGLHVIKEKIGDNEPINTIFSEAKSTNTIATIYTDNTNVPTDYVTSRIMWLDGVEASNKNSHERAIYIHGTPEEGLIGTPQSHGCVRMKNQDVIDLFSLVKSGTYVDITQSLSNSAAVSNPTITLTKSEQANIDKTRQALTDLKLFDYISKVCQENDVPPEIIYGLITVESGGNLNANSGVARGIMQITEKTYNDKSFTFSGKCSWQEYQTSKECQVLAGIMYLKQMYNSVKDKTLYYQCNVNCKGINPKDPTTKGYYPSCANGCSPTDCMGPVNKQYNGGWEAALRRYNGGGSESPPTTGGQSSGCTGQPDYDYVEKVMRYAAGWGYAGTYTAMIQDEARKGIFGSYEIKPSFNVKIDFDMRFFDMLQTFSKEAVLKCGVEGEDKKVCLQKQIDAFNSGLSSDYSKKVSLSMDCDDDKKTAAVNTFIEKINDCMGSSDNECQCDTSMEIDGSTFDMTNEKIENVKSTDASTIFTYDTGSGIKEAYLDYSITKTDDSPWQEKRVSIDNTNIYKDKDYKLIVDKIGLQKCDSAKNRFRLCLKSDAEYYKYTIYDKTSSGTNKIITKGVVIPFALLIRDQTAPSIVNNFDSYNLQHARNDVVLRWDKNKEPDVLNYNLYLSDDKSVFERPTSTLKDSIIPISVSSDPKNYLEFKSIDLENPTCKLQSTSDGSNTNVDYCIFEYTAVDKDDKSIQIELKLNQPYYVSQLNKFIYILNGTDPVLGLSSEKEKFIAITAVDIDGNEIDNTKENQKIEEGKNLISIKPEDKLEPAMTRITSYNVDENQKLTLSWNAVSIYIDGTKLNDMLNYDIYIITGNCNGEQLTDIPQSSTPETSTSSLNVDIKLSQSSPDVQVDYCVYIVPKLPSGGYMQGFAKTISVGGSLGAHGDTFDYSNLQNQAGSTGVLATGSTGQSGTTTGISSIIQGLLFP